MRKKNEYTQTVEENNYQIKGEMRTLDYNLIRL